MFLKSLFTDLFSAFSLRVNDKKMFAFKWRRKTLYSDNFSKCYDVKNLSKNVTLKIANHTNPPESVCHLHLKVYNYNQT